MVRTYVQSFSASAMGAIVSVFAIWGRCREQSLPLVVARIVFRIAGGGAC